MSAPRFLSPLCLAAACLLPGCGGFHADDPFARAFTAILSGSEAVAPATANHIGSGVLTVDLDTGELIATLVVTPGGSALAGSTAHIHAGAPGIAGPIVLDLARIGTSNLWTGSTGLNNAELSALQSGNWYADVHGFTFPVGEIRGQIAESFPSQDQVVLLEQVASHSHLVRRQLRLLQDMDTWRRHRFGFVGIHFAFGL